MAIGMKRSIRDMKIVKNDFCGELREILNTEEYPEVSVAALEDVRPNKGHYHKICDEIYWMLKGGIEVELHDPSSGRTWTERVSEGELLLVRKGIHHKIKSSSGKNTLCAVTHPRWEAEDEHESDVI
jgi:mannose-6-phosphate isomerase-like protein (cupin superfamily)